MSQIFFIPTSTTLNGEDSRADTTGLTGSIPLISTNDTLISKKLTSQNLTIDNTSNSNITTLNIGNNNNSSESHVDITTYNNNSGIPMVRIKTTGYDYSGVIDIQSKSAGNINNSLVSRLKINQLGYVGINNSNPQHALDISGNLAINSSVLKAGTNSLGIYIPHNALSNWKTKLANAGSANAIISVIGDSISQGFNSGDLSTNHTSTSYVGKLRTSLQNTHGDGGSGFISVNMSPNIGGQYYSFGNTTNTSVTSTGTWTANYGEGCASFFANTNTNGSSITFSSVWGSIIDVYYVRSAGTGNISVSIDGVAQTTINSTASNSIAFTTFSGFSSSVVHSVVITHNANPAYSAILGVRGRNSSGVIVDNFSLTGQTSNHFLTRGGTAYGAPTDWSGGKSLPCDLLIYALCVNDSRNLLGAATSPDNYLANLLTVFRAVKDYSDYTGQGTTDILVFLPHIGKWNLSGPDYYLLAERAEGMCRAFGAGFICCSTIYKNSWAYFNSLNGWGSAVGNGSTGTDDVHPSNSGMQLYANILIPIITNTQTQN